MARPGFVRALRLSVAAPPAAVGVARAKEVSIVQDFSVCPHCQGCVVAATSNTPPISRSDASGFHVFLQSGPNPRPARLGGFIGEQVVVHFRYTLDSAGITSEPISVIVKHAGGSQQILLEQIREAADQLAEILQAGERPAGTYELDGGTLLPPSGQQPAGKGGESRRDPE